MILKGKFKKTFTKIFVILGGLAFLWGSVAALVQVTRAPSPEDVDQTQTLSGEEKLRKSAEGYEAVLKNEPENTFVLKELVQVYLQLNDLEAALEPMEKLAAMEPRNQNYQEVLNIIKTGLAQKEQQQNQPNSNSPSTTTPNTTPPTENNGN